MWYPSAILRALRGLTGLLLIAAAGCFDSTGNGAGVVAVVARPVLPAALGTGVFSLDVDRVRLLLVRQPSELLLDTTITFPTDSAQVTIRLKVLLTAQREPLNLAMEMRSGKRVLFSGARAFEAIEGTTIAPIVPLQYVGPGSELTDLIVEPRDSAITPGDTFTFSVRALQGRIPVDSFYVGWASSDHRAVPVNARGTLKAPPERGSTFVKVVSPTGVKDSTRVWFAPAAASAQRLSGDGQEGPVGDPLPRPLVVRVMALDGLAAPGVRVRFVAPFGSRVRDTLVVTDELGLASTIATLGPVPTLYTFEARIPLQPVITFQAIGVAGAPTAIVRQDGDGQSAPAGQTLLPFVVRVQDRFGNGVGEVPVAWSVISGGGSLSAPAATTDPTGRATVVYRLGTLPGANSVQARLGNGASVLFTATGLP